MNKKRSRFVKWIFCLLIGSLVFSQTSFAFTPINLVLGGDSPVISAQTVTPNSFTPQNGETTTMKFYLNTSANYSIEILQNPNSNVVWKGISKADGAGNYEKAWDGKGNYGAYTNQYVPSGAYTVKFTAKKDGYEDNVQWAYLEVKSPTTTQPTVTVPTVTNVTASPAYPQSFNPQAGQTVEIKFYLNKPATYYVDIIKNGVLVDNVTPASGASAQAVGYYTAVWDGKNLSGGYVGEEGTYLARVQAQNSAGWAVAEYVLVLVDYPTGTPATGNNPEVSNDYAYPNPFNPNNQQTKIYYTLNTSATVTVSVLSGTDAKTLKNAVTESAGTYYVTWDGKNAAGNFVTNGSQVYKIIAQNSFGYDVEMGTVDVQGMSTGSTGTVVLPSSSPTLYNLYASPSTFDPLQGSANLCYSVAADASISIAILDSDVEVKKLIDSASRTSGSHCESWNGKSNWDSYANPGVYTVKVFAINAVGYDIEYTTVQINLNNFYTPTSAPDVLELYIDPSPFNPAIENEAIVYYQIDKKAYVKLSIETTSGVHKKTLVDGAEKLGGTNWVTWHGFDKYGNPMEPGEYKLKLEAWNVYGMDISKKKFYLGPSGGITIIQTGPACAGFLDVPQSSIYCQAITMVKNTGVFQGYPDGTFKPNQPINRAEAVKVILLALNKSLLAPDGTNIGFWDIDPFAWYTSYIRTAKVHGIINGYQDGTFKPGNTVNRAELLKMFLEATEIAIPGCFGQPYPDVPKNSPWYLKYACFAKQYNLISTDSYGKLKPGKPMTRGDVADLFFRFQSAGLFEVFPLTNYYN